MRMTELEDRLITDACQANDIVLKDIDYERVDRKILSFVGQSYDFIEKEILQGASCNGQEKDFASQLD